MNNIKKLVGIIIFLLLFSCNDKTATPDDSKYHPKAPEPISVLSDPSLIKGVKWRQYDADEFLQTNVDWWLNTPVSRTKLDVLKVLNGKVNSVIFRVDNTDRFRDPKQTNYNNAMDDIVEAMKLAKDNNIKIDFYLWGRIWLERDGKVTYGGTAPMADAVKEWFRPVLNKAIAAGVLEQIKGIALIETNCDRIEDVKDYALLIADKFNAEPSWKNKEGEPFFKTRSFLVPGVGFGMDFRNINNDNGAFLNAIQNKCGQFAFIYKYMSADHETVTKSDYDNVMINGVSRSWTTDMEANDLSFTVADRKAFLNHFGLDQLTVYIDKYKATYPTASNIVFWGDKWDGISRTPPLSRQALHSLLVKGNGSSVVNTNTGYFFSLAASNTTNTAALKFYLFNNNLLLNQEEGWSGLTVSQEWQNWPTANPMY